MAGDFYSETARQNLELTLARIAEVGLKQAQDRTPFSPGQTSTPALVNLPAEAVKAKRKKYFFPGMSMPDNSVATGPADSIEPIRRVGEQQGDL